MVLEVPLLEVGVIFAAIAFVGAVAKRFDQSVIPFYIITGMVLGPFVFGAMGLPFVGGSEKVYHFIEIGAELGIAFLLFFLGLEFSFNHLLENKSKIGKAGTIDLLNLVLGFAIGYLFFQDMIAAILIGGIVYISSSAIITKALMDFGWIAEDEAEPMLGVLVYEDLFIALYLVVVSSVLLAGVELGIGADIPVMPIGAAIGFILVLLIGIHYGARFFEKVLNVKSSEMFVLRAVGVIILIAGAAIAAGVSEAVAALFVGMAFSSTGYTESLEEILSPLRDIFAAIFFFWIGMKTNPLLILGILPLLIVAILTTAPFKFITAFKGGRIYGLNCKKSTRTGLGMITRGEFSLIIATIAVGATGAFATKTITEVIPAFAVGYVLIMSILGTMLMKYSKPFEKLMKRHIDKN